jgi:hypothetical protein
MAALTSPAGASVMTFEGVVAANADQIPATPYSAAGFTLTQISGNISDSTAIFGADVPPPEPGVTYNTDGTAVYGFCGYCSSPQTIVALTAEGGAAFDLLQLAAGDLETGYPTDAQQLVVLGNLAGGGTVSQTLDLTDTWATFTLSGFDDVTSVDFSAGLNGIVLQGIPAYPDVGIDNITTGVPEPFSLAVFGTAMLGFAAARARRRRGAVGAPMTGALWFEL